MRLLVLIGLIILGVIGVAGLALLAMYCGGPTTVGICGLLK